MVSQICFHSSFWNAPCVVFVIEAWGLWFLDRGSELRAWGSGTVFRVQGSGFRVQGSGFRVQGSGFRVRGSGFMLQDDGFRVPDLSFGE